MTLALGFYAQFESGLPAYALTVLHVDETTIGLAAAVNCVVIIALQMLVVRLTAKRSGATLLMGVGAIWTLSWLVLAAASLAPSCRGGAVRDDLRHLRGRRDDVRPVLNPLTASLAPSGHGRHDAGHVHGPADRRSRRSGPLVAGVVLGAGHGPRCSSALHVAISLLAVFGAWRLRQSLRRRPRQLAPETAPVDAVLAA